MKSFENNNINEYKENPQEIISEENTKSINITGINNRYEMKKLINKKKLLKIEKKLNVGI